MLNHIVLMGRLTRDPEVRYTQSQITVTSFRIAVDRDFGRGEERQTDFIDVVAWRSTGEFVGKYFRKGSMIVVSGRLQMREWQDKDGNKRVSAEVVADNVYFGESARRDGEPRQDGGYSGGRDGGYGGRDGGYGGGRSGGYGGREGGAYGGRDSGGYGGRQAPERGGAGEGGSAFSELDDGDGELPF